MARRPPESAATAGLVLDAGAFIALERRRGHAARLLARLVRAGVPFVTSGGVVAQVWRGGAGRQAPVAMLLHRVEVVPIDVREGMMLGMILGATGTTDPVDAHVVLLARERSWPVLTSDRGDLHTIDASVATIDV